MVTFAPHLAEANDGFGPAYFAQLAQLEDSSFWFRSRNQLLIWALRYYFPHAGNSLEIGCGTGFVLSGIQGAFPAMRLSGGESFAKGVAFAETRLPGVTLFQMDARRIPFESEFDVVGAFDVLEHIQEDADVLLQMFRASKAGGEIILTVPQHPLLWSALDDYSFHKRRFTRRELVQKVQRAGFSLLRATSSVSLLLPLLAVSRMKTRRMRAGFDPVAELNINPILDRALEKVLGIERIAIQSGISFPAGGSLLVVARRDSR